MLTPEELYWELEGTGSPNWPVSEANTYGYIIGGGTNMREKLELFNTIQDSSSPRPITVSIRTPDNVGPGVVSESLVIQGLKTAPDQDEVFWIEAGLENPNTSQTPTAEDTSKWLYVKQIILSGTNESLYAFTQELQDLLLDAIDNRYMPITRTNMLELVSRDGRRSEEMQGFQSSLRDFEAAEQWRAANQPGNPDLYQ